MIRNHYPVPSLTLFCTITQFGDLIINRETRLLATYLDQYYSATYSQPIPSSSDTPQSSHNPSPPPSPTTLHHLYTPFALPHITTIPAEHIYRAHTTTPHILPPSQILSNTPFSLTRHIQIQLLSTPRLFLVPLPFHLHFISIILQLLIRTIHIPLPSSRTHIQISHPHPFIPQWHPLPTPPPNADIPSTARRNPQLLVPIL